MHYSLSPAIRVSGVHSNYSKNEEWLKERKALVRFLREIGFLVKDGSQDRSIELSGTYGVQSHLKIPQAFLFFGQGTSGETLKLLSAVVGKQVLDDDMHMSVNGEDFSKHIINFGNQKCLSLVRQQMVNLHVEKTIRQDIDGEDALIQTPENFDDLAKVLSRNVFKKESVHGDIFDPETIKLYEVGDYSSDDINVPDPDFNVCVFTSAAKVQDSTSVAEARLLGELIAKNGMGLISGLGRIGLMFEVHDGCVKSGGSSKGSNCPHIIRWEGMPEGFAKAWVRPCIYTRMEIMIKQADAIVIGGGGRGGCGTFQELMACVHSITQGVHSRLMRSKDGATFKPIIFDDRKELWAPAIELCKHFGLEEGKHFHIAKGTEQVVDIIQRVRTGEIEKASIRQPLAIKNIETGLLALAR